MTNTETAQAAAAEPANDIVRDILDRVDEVVLEIETQTDEINGLMLELLLSGGLSELAQGIADDVGGTANALFNDLNQRVGELHREIVTNDDTDEDAD